MNEQLDQYEQPIKDIPCLDALNLGHRYCGKHFHRSPQATPVHQ